MIGKLSSAKSIRRWRRLCHGLPLKVRDVFKHGSLPSSIQHRADVDAYSTNYGDKAGFKIQNFNRQKCPNRHRADCVPVVHQLTRGLEPGEPCAPHGFFVPGSEAQHEASQRLRAAQVIGVG